MRAPLLQPSFKLVLSIVVANTDLLQWLASRLPPPTETQVGFKTDGEEISIGS